MLEISSKKSLRRRISVVLLLTMLCVSFMAVTPFGTLMVNADSITQTNALRIVSQYQGVFTSPPSQTNTGWTTDAPLLGNGDVGVAVFNNIDTMTFILDKTEFWSLQNNTLKAMSRMSLAIPSMAGASYHMTEDLSTAEVNGTFTLSGNTITTKSWVQADDTTNNKFITEFTYNGSGTKAVTVSLAPGTDNTFASSEGSSGDVLYSDVRADSADTVGGYNAHKVRVATRVIGTTGTISNNQLSFTLSSGGTYTLITSVMSNYDNSNYQSLAISNINTKAQSDVNNYLSSHHTWWSNFYSKSFIEIPDKSVEKEFYGSLYLMACTSRSGEMSPGLWGNWVMTDPAWSGDYTLNYNYETPFYMTFPTNHVELSDSYAKPVLDWLPNGQALATANGYTGALYCGHIQPLPGATNGGLMNQKSDTAFAATDMIQRYYYTRDLTYANSVYNYIKQSATFWQNYLSWNGTTYDILNDAQQEGDAYPQTNGVMSLGLVRLLLQGAIDMSTALNVDSSPRSTWQNELNNLSPFPTFTRNSQTVFRWTSVGRDWNVGNSIGIQHIYPGSQIGLKSSSTLLSTAQNMVTQMGVWSDDNGTPNFYPAAARIGYAPATILSHLDSWIGSNCYPNLHIHSNGGGIENLNTVPATVCEMLMQSFQNEILPFANWASGTNAKFGDLLAYGNFLVSSDIRSNSVQYLRVISNIGGNFTFKNPWAGQTLVEYKNGVSNGTVSGTDITVSSATNDVFCFAPNGTTYASIQSMLALPLSGSGGGSGSGTPVSLTSNFSSDGFSYTSNPTDGNYDGGGWTYQANVVNTAPTYNGVAYQLGPMTDGSKNVINATGQTITLPQGAYTNIYFLGSGTNGSQTGTFQINYTDATNSQSSITETDWCNSASAPNAAETMATRDGTSGSNSTTNYIDAFSLTPTSGKTVSSLLLPNNSNMHVLAVTVVSPSVALLAMANNEYVCADNSGTSPLIANRTSVGQWESFDLINNSDGTISLRAHANNEYVCADNSGTSPLIANRTSIGQWESFQEINNGDGTISLKSMANNDYVTADNAGASPLIANRTSIGQWEEFKLVAGQ